MTNSSNTTSATTKTYSNYFRYIVTLLNANIADLVSTQSLPLWINPLNSKFYQTDNGANGYKVGQIVIAISDRQLILEYLEPYIRQIARHLDIDITSFKERNNWEIDDDFYDVILYGGYILPQLKIQPLTAVSTHPSGFDIYISTKGGGDKNNIDDWNTDMPGMSDAWLNLRSVSSDALDLTLDNIIEKLEESDYLKNIFDEHLQDHLTEHHFNANLNDIDATETALHKYLDKLEQIYSARINATTNILRMPFLQNGNNIGQITLTASSTNEYVASAIINVDKVDATADIVMPFIPNDSLQIVLPTILSINGDYIMTSDSYIALPNGDNAYAVDSLYTMHDKSLIYREAANGHIPLTLSTLFGGFNTQAYTVVYTPIGSLKRVNKTEIQCMPVEEISRTTTSITFRLNPRYVWKTTALNICATGVSFNA